MAVLFYQVGIFLAIQIAALFGKSSRNTAIILITIFTLLQVFMSWLLLLQLITIYISYNFSKRWFDATIAQQTPLKPNNVIYGFQEKGGHSVMEVDLNDPTLDKDIREKAILQNQIREESNYKYNSDSEYKTLIDNVIQNMVSGNIKNTNRLNPDTKFYYLERSRINGPISAKKLAQLVKTNKISKNCFVRRETTEGKIEHMRLSNY